MARAAALLGLLLAAGAAAAATFPAHRPRHHIARRSTSSSSPSAACLPLLPAGTLFGAQYSAPADPAIANLTRAAFEQVYDAGARALQLSLPWDFLEPSPGVINATVLAQLLATARASGMIPLVNIAVIDTDRVSAPADLVDPSNPGRLAPGLNWTSPQVIDRYAAVVAVAAPLVAYYGGPYFGLGNEVSTNLLAHPDMAVSWVDFCYEMRAYIQSITSAGMAVGATLVVGDLVSMARSPPLPSWLPWLLEVVDVTPLTHYPLNPDFSVKADPAEYTQDVLTAVSLLPPDACLVFQEFGCPSGYGNASSTDGSSQATQATYYTTMLGLFQGVLNGTGTSSVATAAGSSSALPGAGAVADGSADGQEQRRVRSSAPLNRTGTVRLASAYQLVDMPPAACEALEPYYNVTVPAFLEYLCTLGMVDGATGKPKQALQAFLQGLEW